MNYLVVIYKHLLLFLKKDKLLSFILLIINLITFISIFTLYALYMPHLRVNSIDNASYRYFDYELGEVSSNYEAVDNIYIENPLSSLWISGQIEVDNTMISFSSEYISPKDGEYTPNLVSKNLKENEVLVRNIGELGLSIGEIFTYKNNNLKVVGYSDSAEVTFSYKYLMNKHVDFDNITFWTQNVLTGNSYKSLNNFINENFKVADSTTGVDILSRQMQETPILLVVISIFYIISMISFAYVLFFVFERQRYSFWVYRILGLSGKASIILNIISHIILTLISYLIACLLHILFWESFFKNLTTTGISGFSLIDYVIIFILLLIISLILFVPKYIAIARASLATSEGRFRNEL